jgi:hypothetical protein
MRPPKAKRSTQFIAIYSRWTNRRAPEDRTWFRAVIEVIA